MKKKRVFKAAPDADFDDKQAQIYGEELMRIAKKLGRMPTLKEILESAKDKNSPLHDYFEWDDRKAAEKYKQSISKGRTKLLRQQDH